MTTRGEGSADACGNDGDLKAQFLWDADGYRYAGRHIFVDMWEVSRIHDAELVRTTIVQAVSACGATMLDLRLHEFEPVGITAVAVISESHLSFHTWPQENYVAVDVFTCGSLDPLQVVPVLRQQLKPRRVRVTEHKRGYQHLPREDNFPGP